MESHSGAIPDWLTDAHCQEAIRRIENAFDGVSRKGGVTLHEADAIDDYCDEDERAAARGCDTESRWQDVPDEAIKERLAALLFLDPVGLRYYLPAYMVWTLKHYRTSNLCNHTIPEIGRTSHAIFSKTQCYAVVYFLRFFADTCGDENAQQALTGQWRLPAQELETAGDAAPESH